MKYLFYSIYLYTPHFETELELMMKHIQDGDEVCVLTCNRNLKICEYNYHHSKNVCFKCRTKLENGLQKVPQVKVLDFPDIQVDYTVLPKSFESLETLKAFTIEGANIGIGVASSLISRFNRDHNLDVNRYAKEVQLHLKTAWYVYNVIREVHRSEGFDSLYLFNGRISTMLPVLQYCQQNSIPFITHERAGTVSNYSLYPNEIPQSVSFAAQDIERVWEAHKTNPEREAIGKKFYEDRRNRVVQGWVSFTANQENKQLPDDFPSDKRVVTIFNSTIEEYAAIRNSGKEFRILHDEETCLKTLFEHYKDDTERVFYIRIHPNLTGFDNSQTQTLYALGEAYPNVRVIRPEATVDSYELMESSDKVVVLGSTIGAEACYWGAPAIALVEAFYRELDCCYWPKNTEELFTLLESDLKPKPITGAIKYGFWELQRGIPFVYYKPEALFSGSFENETVSMTRAQQAKYLALSLFDKHQWKELFKKLFA